MGTDERGIEVDHVEARVKTGRPGLGPRLCSRRRDPFLCCGVDGLEGPPRRRHRGHIAEEGRLVGQHPQITDGRRPVRYGHGQIDEHLTPVMASSALLGRRHRL